MRRPDRDLPMRHTLAALIRNLVAGFRVACLLPVTQLAFRVDLPQLVLLFVVSSSLDAVRDAIRAGMTTIVFWFSIMGLGGGAANCSGCLIRVAAEA